MPAPILEVRNLVKTYPGVRAVNGTSFRVPEGICFGLLGPNGAGKTTTIEILEGITRPTSGEVLYRGEPLGPRFRREAGIQFQTTSLQDFLTVREQIELFRDFYPQGLSVEELAELCALGDYLDRDSRKLSGGQRQRLLLAIALVNDPALVFLDEPTTGLDPQARRNFWSLIERIKAQRKTIILTTHYMEEAYRLCDYIAIMDHGRIIAEGTPEGLLAQHFSEVVIELPYNAIDGKTLPFVARRDGDLVEILTEDVNAVIEQLLQAGVPLQRLSVRSRTLEDLFLELTGRELRA